MKLVIVPANYRYPMPPHPAFPIAPRLPVPINGDEAGYPVARIFCVGRNHAAEMGNKLDRDAPFYFAKPAQAKNKRGPWDLGKDFENTRFSPEAML